LLLLLMLLLELHNLLLLLRGETTKLLSRESRKLLLQPMVTAVGIGATSLTTAASTVLLRLHATLSLKSSHVEAAPGIVHKLGAGILLLSPSALVLTTIALLMFLLLLLRLVLLGLLLLRKIKVVIFHLLEGTELPSRDYVGSQTWNANAMILDAKWMNDTNTNNR
jgi:hypothetical protein